MKKSLLFGGAVGVILASSIAILAGPIIGSSAKDTYLIRGIVTATDSDNQSLTLFVKSSPDSIKNEQGRAYTIKTDNALLNRWTNGGKISVDLDNINIGEELAGLGTKIDDNSFQIFKVWIYDRTFKAIGNIQTIDTTNQTITINISSVDFKPAEYRNRVVVMKYSPDTIITNNGRKATISELEPNQQTMTVNGKIVNQAQWHITEIFIRTN